MRWVGGKRSPKPRPNDGLVLIRTSHLEELRNHRVLLEHLSRESCAPHGSAGAHGSDVAAD